MPEFDFFVTVGVITVVTVTILTVVAYLIYVERKISAYMQDRIGPNRVGPFGLIQPLVDGAKMFLKEDIIPKHVDKVFYLLAPGVAAGTALLAFAVVPFGPTVGQPAPVAVTAEVPLEQAQAEYARRQQEYQDRFRVGGREGGEQGGLHRGVIAPAQNIGILFAFAVGSLAVYGIILGGWSANSKYSLLGAMRSSAQIISYEIPLGLSLLGVVLLIGSFNLETITDWQTGNGWMVLFQPLAFLIFLTSVFAECNRLPFDLPEAEQELVGGYHTEYSSLKFGLFFLGEYTHMITTSAMCSVLFFGGWHLPFVTATTQAPGLFEYGTLGDAVLKLGVMGFKISCFILFYMLIRWSIPRFRFDQLMGLAWQVMIPLALLNVICVMVTRELDASNWVLTAASLGLFAASAIISTTATPGRRLPRKAAAAPDKASVGA